MIAPRTSILGIDIGGVITEPPKNLLREDAFSGSGQDHLLVPKVKDAFQVIQELSSRYVIVIISKAGPVVQKKTDEWLTTHKFFRETGVGPENVHYTLTRDEKTHVALREGVTHFIDDKLEVLGFMMGSIPNLYAFRANPADKMKMPYISSRVEHVDSWAEVRAMLL